MRQLKKEFIGKGEVRGFVFTQIKESELGYLYRVSDTFSVWYEIFHKKINSRYNCVSYPKSRSFGKWAWTAKTLDKAKDRFDEIMIRGEVNNGR